MDGGDWQVVRRGGRRRRKAASAAASSPSKPENVTDAKRRAVEQRVTRISEALAASPLLREAMGVISSHFGRPQAIAAASGVEQEQHEEQQALEVVAYGLGSFSASSNAVYQLALLVALARALSPGRPPHSKPPEVFDPVMNESDALIAEHFGLHVLSENECGRRRVTSRTIFFMPHCGQALYENVVASNWGLQLSNVVILGNSFTAYSDRIMDAAERTASLLLCALPFVSETPLPLGVDKSHDEFSRYEAAFNDLSVLVFPDAESASQDGELADWMAQIAAGAVDAAPAQDELITGQ